MDVRTNAHRSFIDEAESRGCRSRMCLALAGLGLFALATSVLFCATDLDLTVASWFRSQDAHGAWRWTYDHTMLVDLLYKKGTWPAIAVGVVAAVVAAVGWSARIWREPRRLALFLLLALAIGPGLLVNAVAKDHWGRPRPRELAQFGGTQAYIAPGMIDSESDGKAFPCGHSSVGFALGFALCCWWWRRRRALAIAALAGGIAYGLALGIARMSVGAHFLSDVLWSAYLPGLVALLLWRVFDRKRAPPLEHPDAAIRSAAA